MDDRNNKLYDVVLFTQDEDELETEGCGMLLFAVVFAGLLCLGTIFL